MRPVAEIAKELGIPEEALTYYGRWKAKVALETVSTRPRRGKLVLVTGMTPTSHGEGKTTMSIGLAMGMKRLGRDAIACIRQPSLGPVFGIKGGGAGGGAATLEPMQDINMRFTGDIDAIGAAHNLLASVVDNHIFHGNELGIDPDSIVWPRAMDMDDRALREITVGLGLKNGPPPHASRFLITAASEVMAALCLTGGYADLKSRLGRIVVGYSAKGGPVTAADLKVVGAMGALLRDALQPNLVQTCEGTPALVHGGPFGNIAHGTCSIISTSLALERSEYAVVEAGFGSDLGAEKFVDIVAPLADLRPDVAVIVVTVRALRYHGGLDDTEHPDTQAVQRGLENLSKHIENVRLYGLRPVVAVNRFPGDSSDELRAITDLCAGEGVPSAPSSAFLEGGSGSTELAAVVMDEATKGSSCTPIYRRDQSPREKIETVAKRVYGADGVRFPEAVERDLERIEAMGFSDLPICMAKTPVSLSDDPTKRGRPRSFFITTQGVRVAAGAGFNVVRMGEISLMPGLPKRPAAERIELSDNGTVSGVF